MTAEVVLAEGVRTGRGKGSPRGALHGTPPLTLVRQLLRELEVRGLPATLVEDVVLGCATQSGDQGTNLARTAVLDAAWPPTVPGLMVNRFCASGLEAVSLACARVRAGEATLLVAGGVESVSRVPAFSDGGPLYGDAALGARLGAVHMGVAADLIATLDGTSRDQLDDYAEVSRSKARAAHAAGAFARSLVPVAGLAHDELLDGGPDRQALRALPPAFADRPAEAALALARYPHAAPLAHLHTKGNSPALADAAALLVVGERGAVERAGLVPRARIVATASCAAEPIIMLTAGQLALERALARANLGAASARGGDVRRVLRRGVPAPGAPARAGAGPAKPQRRHPRARPRLRRHRRHPPHRRARHARGAPGAPCRGGGERRRRPGRRAGPRALVVARRLSMDRSPARWAAPTARAL